MKRKCLVLVNISCTVIVEYKQVHVAIQEVLQVICDIEEPTLAGLDTVRLDC